MAKRPDLSAYQKKIVDRYYEHRDTIYVTKLGELVGSIALATTQKDLDKHWKSARDYLLKSGIAPAQVAHICDARDAKALAAQVAKLAAT